MSNFNNKKLKPVEEVTKAINKRGEIKGKSKKETKILRAICPHNRKNKKGKLRPTIFNNNDGSCVCTMCGAKFRAKFYTNEDLGDTVGKMKALNEQSKYMSVACGAGDQTVDYFASAGVILSNYKKSYKKLRNVAEKQGRVKDKKKGGNKGGGSAQYGSWSRR